MTTPSPGAAPQEPTAARCTRSAETPKRPNSTANTTVDAHTYARTAEDTRAARCAVCAALLRQRAESRESGDTRCETECDAELAAHRHGG